MSGKAYKVENSQSLVTNYVVEFVANIYMVVAKLDKGCHDEVSTVATRLTTNRKEFQIVKMSEAWNG